MPRLTKSPSKRHLTLCCGGGDPEASPTLCGGAGLYCETVTVCTFIEQGGRCCSACLLALTHLLTEGFRRPRPESYDVELDTLDEKLDAQIMGWES